MKLLFRFFLPVLLLGIVIPVATMALVQPIAGDLTRVGFLPERAFGWNAPQPPVLGSPGNAASNEAEILVVGDSFSWTGKWQHSAFNRKQRYISYGFGDICADFGAYLQKKGLRPETVVIEVVERMFEQRLLSPCSNSELRPALSNMSAPTLPRRDTNLLTGAFGAKYAIGGALYLARPGPQYRAGNGGGVHVRAVADGCRRFSHSDCDNALFLGDDDNLPSLPLSRFDSPMVAALNAAGIHNIVIVVIPNKTSVYLRSEKQARDADAYLTEFGVRNRVRTVPLNTLFYAFKDRYRDFYFGNDSHLSNEGMIVLGRHLGELLRSQAITSAENGQ